MNFQIENLVSGETTAGRMACFREKTRPGAGPPMHVHTDQVEVFHVVKGRHLFVVDGVETVAEPGACLLVPMGSTHRFQNVGEDEGELHFELLPAGRSEEFFRKLVAGEFEMDKVAEFFEEHGITLV